MNSRPNIDIAIAPVVLALVRSCYSHNPFHGLDLRVYDLAWRARLFEEKWFVFDKKNFLEFIVVMTEGTNNKW